MPAPGMAAVVRPDLRDFADLHYSYHGPRGKRARTARFDEQRNGFNNPCRYGRVTSSPSPRLCLPSPSKFPSASHCSYARFNRGHSLSMMENQVVSRLRPL